MSSEQRFGCLYYGHINSAEASIGDLVVLGKCVRACYGEELAWPDTDTFAEHLYEAQRAARLHPMSDGNFSTPHTSDREHAAVVHLTARLFPDAVAHSLRQTEQRDRGTADLVHDCYPSLYRDGEQGVKIADVS